MNEMRYYIIIKSFNYYIFYYKLLPLLIKTHNISIGLKSRYCLYNLVFRYIYIYNLSLSSLYKDNIIIYII